MIGEMAGQIFLRTIPEHLVQGVNSGLYKVFGSVVRDVATGKGVGFLQEAAPLASMAMNGASLGPVGVAAEVGIGVAQVAQNELIKAGVARLEQAVGVLQGLGIANLALGATGIGVSIAGFAVMSAKIDGVKCAVHGLADQIETVSAKIDALQRDAIDIDFAELKSMSKSFDEAWQLGDDAAARRWHDVARGALSQQSRFELRADRVLNGAPHHYLEADPFLDAVSMASALRVAALAACNESSAAREAAADGARSIERITGGLGLADLSRGVLAKTGALPGTLDWTLAQATANQSMRPIALKIRQREAAAITRAAPLVELEKRAIRPREWLEAARSETNSPVLFMPAGLQNS
ncbi:MAG: hypothetical protein ACK4P4_03150 [Allorhizobium sp.]